MRHQQDFPRFPSVSITLLILLLVSFPHPALPAAGDLVFSYDTGRSIYKTSPAIGADGTIYVGSSSYSGGTSVLCAVNPDGTQKWNYTLPVQHFVETSPSIGPDGTIYAGVIREDGGNGFYLALNPDGTLKWSVEISWGYVYCSAAIARDGTVYALDQTTLMALDPADGSVKWSLLLGGAMKKCSPVVGQDGTIYLAGGGWEDRFYAVNPNGTLKWQLTGVVLFEGSYAIGADGTIYAAGYDDGKLYAIRDNGASGAIKWQYELSAGVDCRFGGPVLGADGTIYIGLEDHKLYALTDDSDHATLKWSFDTGDTEMIATAPAVGSDGTVYVASYYKVTAIRDDGASGTSLWSYTPPSGVIYSSPVISGQGLLIFGQQNRFLYALETGTSAGLASSYWPMLGRSPSHSFLYRAPNSRNLALSSASLDLGGVIPGTTGTASFTVTNNGQAARSVSSVSSSNALFSAIPASFSLAAGASQAMTVSFQPSALGAQSATLTLTSTDPDEPAANVSLSGLGGDPEITVTAPDLTLPTIALGDSSTLSFTIGNSGDAALSVTSITSTNSEFSVSPSTATIAVGQSASFTVKFVPTSAGTRTTTITINSNDQDEAASTLEFSGVCRAPDINLNAASTQFPTVPPGSSSSLSFSIVNSGDTTLSVTSVTSSSPEFNVSPSSASLSPGQSASITVTFAPGSAGNRTATITVNSNDPDEAVSTLEFSGQCTAPVLTLGISVFQLPPAATGSSSSLGFRITNSGNAELIISSITSTNADFSVSPPAANIAIGRTSDFSVTFTPTAAGTRSTTITIVSNDPFNGHQSFDLVGTGVSLPEIELDNTSLSFGTVVTGGSATAVLTVRNTGLEPLVIGSITSSGGAFTVSPDSATIAAGGSRGFTVSFTPTTVGTISGSLTITSNDSDEGSLSVSLTGAGAWPPAPPVFSPVAERYQVMVGDTLRLTLELSDPNGGQISLTLDNTPSGLLMNYSQPGDGQGSCSLSWVPDYGQEGLHRLTFTASDNLLLSTRLVEVEVLARNRQPQFTQPGDRQINEGETLSFVVSASDPDNDALTLSAVDLPAGASFDPSNGLFSFTPGFSQAGSYAPVFTAEDGRGGSASVTVAITVADLNRAPRLAQLENQSIQAGDTLRLRLEATDEDGDPVTITHAGLEGAVFEDGELRWETGAALVGNHAMLVTATDPRGAIAEARATVTVTAPEVPINRPPVLALPYESLKITTGDTLTIVMQGSDPDGDPLRYEAAGLPDFARLDPDRGLCFLAPANGQEGQYELTFRALDGKLSQERRLALEVARGLNRAPQISGIRCDTVRVLVGVTANLAVRFTARDPEGDAVTLSARGLPPGFAFYPGTPGTGDLVWSRSGAIYQPMTVRHFAVQIRATDALGAVADSTQIIAVSTTNRPPTWTILPHELTGFSNSVLRFTIAAIDPDGDPVRYSLPYKHDDCMITLDSLSGAVSFQAVNVNRHSSFILSFQASDSWGATQNSERVGITVYPEEGWYDEQPPFFTQPVKNNNHEDGVSFVVMQGDSLGFQVVAEHPNSGLIKYYVSESRWSFIGQDYLPKGAVFDNLTGVFAWRPSIGQHSEYLYFHAESRFGRASPLFIELYVLPRNNPPRFDRTVTTRQVLAGKQISFPVYARDPDQPDCIRGLLFEVAGATPGLQVTATGKTVTDGFACELTVRSATRQALPWEKPGETVPGESIPAVTNQFMLICRDNGLYGDPNTSRGDTLRFTIEVLSKPLPPVFDPLPDVTLYRNEVLELDLSAYVRAGPVTFTCDRLAHGARLDRTTGLFRLPFPNRDCQFVFKVTNGWGLATTGTLKVYSRSLPESPAVEWYHNGRHLADRSLPAVGSLQVDRWPLPLRAVADGDTAGYDPGSKRSTETYYRIDLVPRTDGGGTLNSQVRITGSGNLSPGYRSFADFTIEPLPRPSPLLKGRLYPRISNGLRTTTSDRYLSANVMRENKPPVIRLVEPNLGDPWSFVVGSEFRATILCSDPDDDPVTVTATGMPPGATLKKFTDRYVFSYTPTVDDAWKSCQITLYGSDGMTQQDDVRLECRGLVSPATWDYSNDPVRDIRWFEQIDDGWPRSFRLVHDDIPKQARPWFEPRPPDYSNVPFSIEVVGGTVPRDQLDIQANSFTINWYRPSTRHEYSMVLSFKVDGKEVGRQRYLLTCSPWPQPYLDGTEKISDKLTDQPLTVQTYFRTNGTPQWSYLNDKPLQLQASTHIKYMSNDMYNLIVYPTQQDYENASQEGSYTLSDGIATTTYRLLRFRISSRNSYGEENTIQVVLHLGRKAASNTSLSSGGGSLVLAASQLELQPGPAGLTLAADQDTVRTWEVDEGGSLELDLAVEDPDSLGYEIRVENLPDNGWFDHQRQKLFFQPDHSQAGDYLCLLQVSNPAGTSSQYLALRVREVNQPPRIMPVGDKFIREGRYLSFEAGAEDPDGDSLSLSYSPFPEPLAVENGLATFPSDELDPERQVPPIRFAWQARDSRGGEDSCAFNLAVIRPDSLLLPFGSSLAPGDSLKPSLRQGLGLELTLRNNGATALPVSGRIDLSEISGPLTSRVANDLARGWEASHRPDMVDQDSLPALAASGHGRLCSVTLANGQSATFCGIRRAWRVNIDSLTLEPADSAAAANLRLTFRYLPEDLDLSLPGVPEDLFRRVRPLVAAWDSLLGSFVLLDGTVDTLRRTATFTIPFIRDNEQKKKIVNRQSSYSLFTLGTLLDFEPPRLELITNSHNLAPGATCTIVATASDNLTGLAGIRLCYRIGGRSDTLQMVQVDDRYQACLPKLPSGAIIQYYVEAWDRNGNLARAPMNGERVVTVSGPGRTDFDGDGRVTIHDLLQFLKLWRQAAPECDINQDGYQDAWDLLIICLDLQNGEAAKMNAASLVAVLGGDGPSIASAGSQAFEDITDLTVSLESSQEVLAAQFQLALPKGFEVVGLEPLTGRPGLAAVMRTEGERKMFLVSHSGEPLPAGQKLLRVRCRSLEGRLLVSELVGLEEVRLIRRDNAPAEGELVLAGLQTLPKAFALRQNVPNPFNPSTTIGFDIAEGAVKCRVRLEIFNLRGQLVNILVDEENEPGRYMVLWDGRDGKGRACPSGAYFYRLRAGDFVQVRKLVLLK